MKSENRTIYHPDYYMVEDWKCNRIIYHPDCYMVVKTIDALKDRDTDIIINFKIRK